MSVAESGNTYLNFAWLIVVAGKRSSKKSRGRAEAKADLAKRSSWTYFEATTTALILAVYGVLIAHPIDLTVGDLGRHLKNGELVVRNGLIADANLFSYTHPDHPFINHHWGSGAVFYLIEQAAGFAGLSVAFVALSAVTLWLFLKVATRSSSFPLAALMAVLCLPILITRHEIRPELFSYLLSGLFLFILTGYQQHKFSFRALYGLPVLQICWVNLHIYFFIGIFLVAAFFCEAVIMEFRRRGAGPPSQSKGLAVILLLTLLASCINPAGLSGALYPLFIMRGYEFPVIENFSVATILRANYIFLPLKYFLIILAALAASWVYVSVKDRSRISFANLLLTLFFTAIAWWGIRNFALFAYFALPVAAANFKQLLAQSTERTARSQIRTAVTLAGAAIFLLALSPVYFLGGGRGGFGLGLAEGTRAAAEFWHRQNLQGPIYNDFDVGGYLAYFLYPQQRLFVDNRPEAYPSAFFRDDYFPLQQNEDRWMRRSPEFGFNAIVFNHRARSIASEQFIVRRVLDPAWAPVYFDKYLIIFVKRFGPNDATAVKFALTKEQVLTR